MNESWILILVILLNLWKENSKACTNKYMYIEYYEFEGNTVIHALLINLVSSSR